MSRKSDAASALDASVIRFEIRDGIRRISCAIADDALEAASGLTVPSTLVLRRRSFDRFRTLIDAAAQLKSRSLPPGSAGPILLTREDLQSVPPQHGEPPYGSSSGRGMARAAVHGHAASRPEGS
jgi:hypothetical protein